MLLKKYKKNKTKITVVGCGYVGLSFAILLSEKHNVLAYDISKDIVDKVNAGDFLVNISDLKCNFKKYKPNLIATQNKKRAFVDTEYLIICVSTDYNEKKEILDTSNVESIIKEAILLGTKATIVIKSTIPVGFTEKMREKYNYNSIIFSPEFLREDQAIYDILYPTRIVIGGTGEKGKKVGEIFKQLSLKKDVKLLFMSSKEAEAVKLLSNAYLALRVSFFNELDTFAELKGLNTKKLISAVSLDPRIGDYYNNPSFGYGGYCLTKDIKQLRTDYCNIPQDIISAIIKSNITRKKHIAKMVLDKKPKVVGIYRLLMKTNSDNFRESAILDIIKILKNNKIKIIIYEPKLLTKKYYLGCEVINEFDKFSEFSDLILANRFDNNIEKVKNKLYSRDIYNRD